MIEAQVTRTVTKTVTEQFSPGDMSAIPAGLR